MEKQKQDFKQYYDKHLELASKVASELLEIIKNDLTQKRISAKVEWRFKTIESCENKIRRRNILHNQIEDIIGLRIITRTVADCYKVFGILLTKWPIMTNKIKDYIALPKKNGYQSIHLTIIYKEFPAEIQIRTTKMHRNATVGLASRYKKVRI